MDISSGIVDFGVTCPGSLMQKLQKEDAENVRNIKSFHTSFSKRVVTYQCHANSKDLATVPSFIESIDALEQLSILNYEMDTSMLWPAIFYHGESLKRLAIHTPPQMRPDVWTASIIKEVGEKLTALTSLEMDISLEEGERILNNKDQPSNLENALSKLKDKGTSSVQDRLSAIARSLVPEPFKPTTVSVLDQLTNMDQLESLLINVNLMDEASVFAPRHTYSVQGTISFPGLNKDACQNLAQQIFDAFHAKNPYSALNHLELRFPRRQWDDRAQFGTLSFSLHVRKDEKGSRVEIDPNWKMYLPDWPTSGILRLLSDEGYAEASKSWR